jgi:hypothetical protein
LGSGTIPEALGICLAYLYLFQAVHSSVQDLVTAINTGTTHIKVRGGCHTYRKWRLTIYIFPKATEGRVPAADARIIVDGVKGFVKTIVDTLALLIKNRPTTPIGGVSSSVLQDVRQLSDALTAYYKALVALLPVCCGLPLLLYLSISDHSLPPA